MLIVLPVSVLIAIVVAVLDFKAGASGWNACLQAVLAVISLQFGYVIGAMLAYRWHIFSAPGTQPRHSRARAFLCPFSAYIPTAPVPRCTIDQRHKGRGVFAALSPHRRDLL
jgi:hypothetical protein